MSECITTPQSTQKSNEDKIDLRILSLRLKQLFGDELKNAYYIKDIINGKEELIGYFKVLITKDDVVEEIEVAKLVRIPLRIKQIVIAKHNNQKGR